LDIRTALAMFAETYDLNIVPDSDVTGTVTVNVRNLPLDKVLDALLAAWRPTTIAGRTTTG